MGGVFATKLKVVRFAVGKTMGVLAGHVDNDSEDIEHDEE